MLSKNELFNVGYIAKTNGFDGDLILVLDVDEVDRYKALTSLYIETQFGLTKYLITHYKLNNNTTATLHLKDIDSFEQARTLVKANVYLPLSLLPVLTGNAFYFHEIIGFNVIDKQYGPIGIAEGVVEMVHQNLLQVKKERKEILIPLKDEFIELVDRPGKTLYINAPEGLIDIYLNPAKFQEDEEIDFNFDSSD